MSALPASGSSWIVWRRHDGRSPFVPRWIPDRADADAEAGRLRAQGFDVRLTEGVAFAPPVRRYPHA